MSSNGEDFENIKQFFKSNVSVETLEGVLDYGPDTIFGIDSISAKALKQEGIKTIQHLANLNEQSPPKIAGILPRMLIKWIKIAGVLEKVVRNEIKQRKKIVLIGLDNGGKSSILAVLQNEYSKLQSLLPTKGVKREKLDFFGFPIISWDLGGQIQYRETYFEQPELYFSGVDLILYVIDVQDPERFEVSADYFKKILESIKSLEEKPTLHLIIHKSDQDFRKNLKWQQNVKKIKDLFNPIINKFDGLNTKYIDTTIYQQETVLQMLSEALKEISDTSKIIDNIMEELIVKIKARAASLISLEGLIFGGFQHEKKDGELLNNTALQFHTMSNFHTSMDLVREREIVLEMPLNEFIFKGEILFEYSEHGIPVYLWILTENPALVADHVATFKQQLSPLIHLFL
ncbi:MAG: Small GTP-binding domain protein, Arf-/Gtr1/RagA G protein domain signature [Promethearchaeota archaeon]|nr:MAG: Small GTP-binding domain protein, Arf-/Gtr1/RagA G protein domain signature [Candidatus Lokiarchaeota archaeon]